MPICQVTTLVQLLLQSLQSQAPLPLLPQQLPNPLRKRLLWLLRRQARQCQWPHSRRQSPEAQWNRDMHPRGSGKSSKHIYKYIYIYYILIIYIYILYSYILYNYMYIVVLYIYSYYGYNRRYNPHISCWPIAFMFRILTRPTGET